MNGLNEDRWNGYKHGSDQRDYLASLEKWCVANGEDVRAQLAAELVKQQHANAEMAEAVEHSRAAAVRMAADNRALRKSSR